MKEDTKKVALFNQMCDAVYDYKFYYGTYENAKSTISAYAEYSNISYEKACDIVMDLFR